MLPVWFPKLWAAHYNPCSFYLLPLRRRLSHVVNDGWKSPAVRIQISSSYQTTTLTFPSNSHFQMTLQHYLNMLYTLLVFRNMHQTPGQRICACGCGCKERFSFSPSQYYLLLPVYVSLFEVSDCLSVCESTLWMYIISSFAPIYECMLSVFLHYGFVSIFVYLKCVDLV